MDKKTPKDKGQLLADNLLSFVGPVMPTGKNSSEDENRFKNLETLGWVIDRLVHQFVILSEEKGEQCPSVDKFKVFAKGYLDNLSIENM